MDSAARIASVNSNQPGAHRCRPQAAAFCRERGRIAPPIPRAVAADPLRPAAYFRRKAICRPHASRLAVGAGIADHRSPGVAGPSDLMGSGHIPSGPPRAARPRSSCCTRFGPCGTTPRRPAAPSGRPRPAILRVTPLGRVLRRLHLDELPQLLNILKGEMSLVGPRPERPEFVQVLTEAIPGYRSRLGVPPGVTGLAQLNLPPDSDSHQRPPQARAGPRVH